MRVNLLPWRDAVYEKKIWSGCLFLLLVLFISLVLIVYWYVNLKHQLTISESRMLELNTEKSVLEKKYFSQIALEKKLFDLEKINKEARLIASNSEFIYRALIVIAENIPESVRLSSIQQTKKSVVIVGQSKNIASLMIFLRLLRNTRLFSAVELNEITNNGGEYKFSASLWCKL